LAEQVEQRRTDPRTAPEVLQRKVDFAHRLIERMESEVAADNPEQQSKLAELKTKAEELRQRMGQAAPRAAGGTSVQQAQGQPAPGEAGETDASGGEDDVTSVPPYKFGSVEGDQVAAGTRGRHGGPVDVPALPPSPGQPPPGRLPGLGPLSPEDLNPNLPDLRPPEVDTRLDGYPAHDPISVRDQTYHQGDGQGDGQAQAASSPQATSSGAWAAVTTKWAPAGLVVALAALLAVGCKGVPCSNLLRPALPGVPVTPVPGHLQG
jgi:hypothetical protein